MLTLPPGLPTRNALDLSSTTQFYARHNTNILDRHVNTIATDGIGQ